VIIGTASPAASAPSPVPVAPTRGPKDWKRVPIAYLTTAEGAGTKNAFGNVKTTWDLYFFKPARTNDLMEAVEVARRRAVGLGRDQSYAVGVLQAKNGAMYTTVLRDGYDLDSRFYSFEEIRQARPAVDALRAIVGANSWIRFDNDGGSAPRDASPI
jgi:hypothetical protein